MSILQKKKMHCNWMKSKKDQILILHVGTCWPLSVEWKFILETFRDRKSVNIIPKALSTINSSKKTH